VLARQLRALHQHAKLKPRHLRMDGAKAHKCAEAAIGARHHALAADKTGIALDPLSDEFWMLEHVRLGVDDARDDDLIGRKLDLLEQRPFVFVLRVRALERIGRDVGGGSRISLSATSW
jgi:hypothetical protein